jgi:tetratricopeptide (TPR) repeat protein
VLRIDPKNPAALYFRAYANEKLRRYHFARLDYEALLQLVPGNFEAQLGLALLNQKDMHYTEAYNQLNLLAEIHPDSAVVFAARAGLESERKMLELAEYDYSKALTLQPDQCDWLLARANLRLQLKRKADAEEDLDRLVALGIPRSTLEEYYEKLGKGKKRSRKRVR